MLRVLELFCGIGGCAAAIGQAARVVAAVDIHRIALEVYAHNFSHPTLNRTIESLTASQLVDFAADVWWLSPPCQPYTHQGLQRDEDDPRALSFRVIIDHLAVLRPTYIGLENVPPFALSRMHRRLMHVLRDCDYQFDEQEICATEVGLPQQRRRYYLVASRRGDLRRPRAVDTMRRSLPDILDADAAKRRYREDADLHAYRGRLHVVAAADDTAVTRCFTSAYGRSPLRSGSYLAHGHGRPQHFSPAEILRLLGFPKGYELPSKTRHQQAWSMIGNSLAVPAIRRVLSAIPGLAEVWAADC